MQAQGAPAAPTELPASLRQLPRRPLPARHARGPAPATDTARSISALESLTPAERARHCRTLEDVVAWADELGLNGPLGGVLPDADRWLGTPSDTEREMADTLLRNADWDALHANAPSWVGAMKTALHWLALFRVVVPTMIIFKPLLGPDREANAIHMQEMWARFGSFMRRHGSIRDGRQGVPSRSDNVTAVIGTLRAYRQLGARYSLLRPEFNTFMRKVQKRWRHEDGPRLERKLALGIRGRHFLQLDSKGWDRTSPVGVYDHALASTCKAACGRGGEPGTVDGGTWRPARGVTIADASEWFEASPSANAGLPWMRLWWFPIKDTEADHTKCPVPIHVSKRTSAPRGSDPACPYDALLAWFEVRSAAVPRAEWAQQPLFVHPRTGKIPNTRYVAGLAKRMGALFGLPDSALGGKSFRIAAASDMYHAYGEHAKRLLKERGRWHSDIAYIYARMSEGAHLEASQRTSGADAADVEAATGWAQTAR